MNVSALCEICHTGEVRHTCARCATLVCEEHFEGEIGFCVECLADVGERPRYSPEDAPDGVDTYRF